MRVVLHKYAAPEQRAPHKSWMDDHTFKVVDFQASIRKGWFKVQIELMEAKALMGPFIPGMAQHGDDRTLTRIAKLTNIVKIRKGWLDANKKLVSRLSSIGSLWLLL